jgi:hypothetical protein
MIITMPSSFPETDFQAFGAAANAFFPAAASREAIFDPLTKRRCFERSWMAVRYRYRSCAECNEEFKVLFAKVGDMWKLGGGDDELMYQLERCIYLFFMGGLSAFDSFAFCLYFYGNAVKPHSFPDVAKPRRVTRDVTAKALKAAFPQAAITGLLATLSKDTRFNIIDTVRNLVGHRLSGRRSVRFSNKKNTDGTHTHGQKETWHIPSAAGQLTFDAEMLQRHLDDITGLLAALSLAAREFAEEQKKVHGK